MSVTVTEKIEQSHYWLSGEPFTVQDMRLALDMSAASVQAGLRTLGERVSKHTEQTQNGQRTTYQRKTLARDYLRKRWVSGEFHVRGEVPMEWMRGA